MIAACTLALGQAQGAPNKILRFWNLTAATVTELYLAPAGTSRWSANLCLGDPDHSVDPDERIGMIGIAGGRYDVRIVDHDKRSCLFHDLAVHAEGAYAFSISEGEMKSCTAK